MKVHEELAKYVPSQGTVLTIGVFDGVHRGHRHLLTQLKTEAMKRKALAGIVTFRNHPRVLLQPELTVSYLTSLEERIGLLRETGVDLVVPITFDLELSHLRAWEFINLLQERLFMKGLVIGPGFAMGHHREGDAKTLTTLGQEMGFSVHVVEALALDDMVMSSTAIRDSLRRGDVVLAATMLGRNFSVTGTVYRGEERGKGLGFPTANLDIPEGMATPGDGVYTTWAYLGHDRFMSATNVGVRPTFGSNERTVEAFILDFQGDLYGKEIRLEFCHRLRDEIRFDTVEALQSQMARDVEQTRTLLETSRSSPLPRL